MLAASVCTGRGLRSETTSRKSCAHGPHLPKAAAEGWQRCGDSAMLVTMRFWLLVRDDDLLGVCLRHKR